MTIAQLQNLISQQKTRLTELHKRRKKVEKELYAIDAEIGGVEGGKLAANGNGSLRRRPRNEKPLAEAMHEVMATNGKPMSVGDVLEAVEKSGYQSSSANFRGIINQTLIKDKRFSNSSRGMYEAKKGR